MMHYQRRRRRRRCHDDDTKKEAGQYDGEKGCNYVRRLTVAIMNLTLIATFSSMSVSSSSIGVALGFCSHHRYQRQHRPPSSFLSAVGVTASVSSSVISVPPPNSRMGRRSSNYLTRQNYISSSSSSSCTDQYFGCDTIDDVTNTDENNSSSSSSSMMLVGNNGEADTVPSSSSSLAIVTNNTTTSAPTTKIQQKYSILSRYRRRQVLRSSSYSSSFRRLQLQQQNNYNLTTTSASSSRRSRRKSSSASKKTVSMSRLEYEQRKAAWAAKYTSVNTLRATFGINRNKFWGDFDACTTRKLYHTLLPRALLELRILRDGLINYSDTTNSSTTSETNSTKKKTKKRIMKGEQRWWWWKKKKRNQVDGRQQREDERMKINNVAVNDINNSNTNNKHNEEEDDFVLDNITYLQQELKELAPLAFRARLAAKEYARERSRLPGRIGSMLYDGYRSWIKYGKWKSSGMTWEQVWNKYEDQVLNEAKISNVVGKPTTTTTNTEQQQQQQMLTPLRSERTNRDDDNDITTAATNSVEISTITSLLGGDDNYNLNNNELTARICLRILERSVVTNDAIDRLFLKRRGTAEDDDIQQQQQQHQQLNDVGGGNNSSSTSPIVNNSNIKDGILIVDGTSKRQQRKRKRKLLLQEQKQRLKLRMQADLQSIEKKFDEDIQELLRYSSLSSTNGDTRRNSRRKQRGTYFWERDELKSSSSSISGSTVGGIDKINATDNDDDERKVTLMEFDTRNNIDDAVILGNVQNTISSSPLRKLSTNEVATLRILVKTRKRLTQLLRRTR